MDISIIITCLNEEENIGPCLASLVEQNYSKGIFEIIIVDGGSNDSTVQVIETFKTKYPNIILVTELRKGAAVGRNAGINKAVFDHVAFIDADCEAPLDWLEILAENFLRIIIEDRNMIAVGGANIPPAEASRFTKSIGVALDTYAGSFNSVQGRQFLENKKVASLATLNALYEKKPILDIGCFDESLASEAEDADLNFRLGESDHSLYFICNSFVWHKMRPTPFSWFKNMFRYGKGRARLLKRHPAMWRLAYLLPLLFCLGMSAVILTPMSNIFLLPLLYVPLLGVFSFYLCLKKGEFALVGHVAIVFLIQHFGYAFGEAYGLLNPSVR